MHPGQSKINDDSNANKGASNRPEGVEEGAVGPVDAATIIWQEDDGGDVAVVVEAANTTPVMARMATYLRKSSNN